MFKLVALMTAGYTIPDTKRYFREKGKKNEQVNTYPGVKLYSCFLTLKHKFYYSGLLSHPDTDILLLTGRFCLYDQILILLDINISKLPHPLFT